MSYKTFVSMNIAIIGISEIAESYALALAGAGHEVYMAWNDSDSNNINPVLETIERINIRSIEEAAGVADIIIIATSPIYVREVAYWLGDVRRKVIIDATSNVFVDADELVKTVCAIKAITGSQYIVKAFHTKGYESLLKPLFNGEQVDMILVGDSKKAKEAAKIFSQELGVHHWYDFGGDESISLFNAMTTSLRELAGKMVLVKKQRDAIKY